MTSAARSLSRTAMKALPSLALETLMIAKCGLKKIDLSPLATCSTLDMLLLNGNNFEEINLSPLAGCRRLETLYLEDNCLTEIDLTPLRHCTILRVLSLARNAFYTIDIRPLVFCKKLEELRLDGHVRIRKHPILQGGRDRIKLVDKNEILIDLRQEPPS